MKNILLSLIFMVATITSFAGQIITKTYKFDNITSIDASYAYNITATQGSSNNVIVVCPEYLEKHLIITNSNGTLKLSLQPPIKTRRNETQLITVRLEMQTIKNINLYDGECRFSAQGSFLTDDLKCNLSGVSTAIFDNVEGKTLNVDCGGASQMTIRGRFDQAYFDYSGASKGNIWMDVTKMEIGASGATQLSYRGASDYVEVDMSGASNLMLEGSTRELACECSGASVVRAQGFIAQDVRVEVSGASQANVYASGSLNTEMSGGSTINYIGNPKQLICNPSHIRKAD